jgi:hypothetical protein
MKGLKIASQIRYIHYFHNFLLSTFNKPYKQLIAAQVRDPNVYDELFLPQQLLKLTSICIGPFEVNPESGRGMKVEIKLYNFCESNLLEHAFLDKSNRDQRQASGKNFQPNHYTQRAVYDALNAKYYFLILFSSLMLVEEDICIKIKSMQTPNQIEPFKFRYWLHAKYVKN